MKPGIKKPLLYLLAVFVTVSVIWVIFPRLWSGLNPEKPPYGYHFMAPAYLALWTGLEHLADLEPDIPEDIEEIKNIEYKNVNGKSLQLDIYRPEAIHAKPPLLVFIHGGAWKSGKRSDYLVYLISFARKGYITATVSYRLLDENPYPACAEDIRDAVKWFFNNSGEYGYDPGRIAVIGGSAGAHLAMLAAYGWGGTDIADTTMTDNRIRAVVDIYGPADLTTEYARNHPLVTSFLARLYDESPELFLEASPVNYLDKNDPPTLILHGTSDRLVPVSQSDDLKARLDSLGVPCTLYRLPGWPHTMDIVERVNKFCQDRMEEFFKEYLK